MQPFILWNFPFLGNLQIIILILFFSAKMQNLMQIINWSVNFRNLSKMCNWNFFFVEIIDGFNMFWQGRSYASHPYMLRETRVFWLQQFLSYLHSFGTEINSNFMLRSDEALVFQVKLKYSNYYYYYYYYYYY